MPMATSVAAVPVRLPAVLLAAIRLPIQTAHPLTRIAHPLILAVAVAARQVYVLHVSPWYVLHQTPPRIFSPNSYQP